MTLTPGGQFHTIFFGIIYAAIGILHEVLTGDKRLGALITPKKFYEIDTWRPILYNIFFNYTKKVL